MQKPKDSGIPNPMFDSGWSSLPRLFVTMPGVFARSPSSGPDRLPAVRVINPELSASCWSPSDRPA